jgi:hypothetical protein
MPRIDAWLANTVDHMPSKGVPAIGKGASVPEGSGALAGERSYFTSRRICLTTVGLSVAG